MLFLRCHYLPSQLFSLLLLAKNQNRVLPLVLGLKQLQNLQGLEVLKTVLDALLEFLL
jgi:hypothetical protein